MSHSDQVELVRGHLKREEYSAAVELGRHELINGCDSSELLILMSTAVLLSDGSCGSLAEARQWLEHAANVDPRSVEASLELAHFLDAVADEQELAVKKFELAAGQALDYLEDALEGLGSAGGMPTEIRRRIEALLQT